jgi:NADP-dependent 3-hydroxy acid dehydrogenase YdfG
MIMEQVVVVTLRSCPVETDKRLGYTSSKHAQRALSETMRLEFHGKPVRVTDVSPGAVETEFSVVRFAGDAQAAKKVVFVTPLEPPFRI